MLKSWKSLPLTHCVLGGWNLKARWLRFHLWDSQKENNQEIRAGSCKKKAWCFYNLFLLLPFTFFFHRIVEMSSWNSCDSSSSITLISQMRPQKGQMTSSGSHSFSGARIPSQGSWYPVRSPVHPTLCYTTSKLQHKGVMCLSKKSSFKEQ